MRSSQLALSLGRVVAMLALASGCSSPTTPVSRPLSNDGANARIAPADAAPSGWWCYDDGCARSLVACADRLAEDTGRRARESQPCRAVEVAHCAGEICMPDHDGCEEMRRYMMGANKPTACVERR